MWQKLDERGPREVAWQTEAVYTLAHTESGCRVGVMRPSLFSPPVLWFTYERACRRDLRHLKRKLSALLVLLGEPLVYAETASEADARFAEYAGFEFVTERLGRRLYKRSL